MVPSRARCAPSSIAPSLTADCNALFQHPQASRDNYQNNFEKLQVGVGCGISGDRPATAQMEGSRACAATLAQVTSPPAVRSPPFSPPFPPPPPLQPEYNNTFNGYSVPASALPAPKVGSGVSGVGRHSRTLVHTQWPRLITR